MRSQGFGNIRMEPASPKPHVTPYDPRGGERRGAAHRTPAVIGFIRGHLRISRLVSFCVTRQRTASSLRRAMQPSTIPNLRLGLILWLAGMAGVVAVVVQVLPQMLHESPEPPLPIWALYVLSGVQSGVVLGLMVLIGIKLGPACGLDAPILRDRSSWQASRLARTLAPAAGFGIISGIVLALAPAIAPAELAALDQKVTMPLLSRVLYGGITEELLIRWGIMTLFFWLLLRPSRWVTIPRDLAAAIAIAVSALLFGLGHLPAASQFIGHLDREIVTYIVGVNMLFGCLFGWLFYRRGLEHAIVAHAVTHIVAVAIAALSG